MGIVYRAKDPVLNREVAVKLIPPGNLTKDAEERFQREAQIVAQMDHPGIVPIYDFGRHEGPLRHASPAGTHLGICSATGRSLGTSSTSACSFGASTSHARSSTGHKAREHHDRGNGSIRARHGLRPGSPPRIG
jgi:serine/threonine protein kinase